MKFVGVQAEEFQRLGVRGDFDDPYLTLNPAYEAGNVKIFKEMYRRGMIYKGSKPIHWCMRCKTALAEAEIEYSDETSDSIYVKFWFTETPEPLRRRRRQGRRSSSGRRRRGRCRRTSPSRLPMTPTTSACKVGDEVLVMAEELVGQVVEVAGIEEYAFASDADGEVIRVKGAELSGAQYRQPIHEGVEGVIITGAHVELSTGTGAVHTAPGHGEEDWLVGREFDLPMPMPVDDNGVFDEGGGPFAGMHVNKANPKIIEWLAERGTRCHAGEDLAQLPALLALQAAGHLPRDRAVVRLDGPRRRGPPAARGRARRDREGRVDPGLVGQPHQVDGHRSPRLVHLPPACLGRADPGLLVREVRRDRGHSRDLRCGHRALRDRGRRCVVHQGPSRVPPAGHRVLALRWHRARAPRSDIVDVWWESGVSHTSVLEAAARAAIARPSSTSRAPTSTAGGSSPVCSRVWVPTTRRRSRRC